MTETTDPSGSYSSRVQPAFRDNTQLIAVIYWMKANEMEGDALVDVKLLFLDFSGQAMHDTFHTPKEWLCYLVVFLFENPLRRYHHVLE